MVLLKWVLFKKKKTSNLNIFICGLIPRDKNWSINRKYIKEINDLLKSKCKENGFTFIDQNNGWTHQVDDKLVQELYYRDSLHLIEKGNQKLAKSISTVLKHSKSTCSYFKNNSSFVLDDQDFP